MIVAAIIIRLAAGSMDTGIIESYARERGWELMDGSWDPFGPGWFGEQDSRIYQIVYRGEHGDVHRARVKTSLFSGVYLTNDVVVEHARDEPVDENGARYRTEEELRQEVKRLRRRLRELEDGQETV